MRAVVVRQPGGPESLVLAELPDPQPGPGQLLVDVEAAGVNPVDAGNRSDGAWAGLEAPYVVGYEFAGRVADPHGHGDLRVGDPVWGLFPSRGTRWGTYAERVVVDRSLVARRPEALDAVSAAVLPLAGGTALQVLDRLALDPGESLLVHGAAGGVGHLLVQMAAARDLRAVAVCRPEEQERLLGLGAVACVDRQEQPSAAAAAVVALGHELDAAVDLVGGRLATDQYHVRRRGRLATVVDLAGDFEEAIDRNLTIHGVLLERGPGVLEGLARAVALGVRPTIRGTYPLADARAAHERLEAGGVGGKLALLTRE